MYGIVTLFLEFVYKNNESRWICRYMPDSDTRKETIMQLIETEQFKVIHDENNWLIDAK
jgi:hypothetical protein